MLPACCTAGALASLERRAGNLPLALSHVNRALKLNSRHTPSLQEKALIFTAQVRCCAVLCRAVAVLGWLRVLHTTNYESSCKPLESTCAFCMAFTQAVFSVQVSLA